MPDLFTLYASQIFKATLPSQLKLRLRYSRSYRKFVSENAMTWASTYLTLETRYHEKRDSKPNFRYSLPSGHILRKITSACRLRYSKM